MSKRKLPVKTTHTKRGRPFRVALEAIPEPKPVLTFDDFYTALVAVDEIMSGCKINYVCIGNTYEVITGKTPQFTEPLTICTLRTELGQYALSAMHQLTNPTFVLINGKVEKIILPMGIIKVELTVLEGNFRPIKNFDLKYFNYDLWKIPNPIEEFNRILKELYA